MGVFQNLIGQTFGRLTVKEVTSERRNSSVVWLCDCTCGNKDIKASSKELKTGMKKSCGCLQKERQSEAGKKTKNLHPKRINQRNRKIRKDSSSGIKNVQVVTLLSGQKRFLAYISIKGKKTFLGSFRTSSEATEAVAEAAEIVKFNSTKL